MYELMYANNLNAADMTSLLCKLGDGDMREGIRKVFIAGRNSERVRDALVGVGVCAGTVILAGLCYWGVRKHRARTKQQKETQVKETDVERIVCENGESVEMVGSYI